MSYEIEGPGKALVPNAQHLLRASGASLCKVPLPAVTKQAQQSHKAQTLLLFNFSRFLYFDFKGFRMLKSNHLLFYWCADLKLDPILDDDCLVFEAVFSPKKNSQVKEKNNCNNIVITNVNLQ